MKKLLLIAVVALGVISCNKDKEDEVTPTVCGQVTEINYDSGGYYVMLDSVYKHYVPNGNYQYGQVVCTD